MTMQFCRPVEKQDGGLAMRDEDNGVIETTTAIEIGLPRPQGCSQSFIEGESWQDFEDKFRMYALATDLHRDSCDVQMTTLFMWLDGDSVEAYESFTYATGQSKHDLQCVLGKYSEYYSGSRESRRRSIARGRAASYDVTHTEDHQLIWKQGYDFVLTENCSLENRELLIGSHL